MRLKTLLVGTLSGIGLLVAPATALAASTVVVTPSNTHDWTSTGFADTRPGGAVNFVADGTSPFPSGALQLTTDSTTTAKAQYEKPDGVTKLSQVTKLGYQTKQNSASFASGDASYQLPVCLYGIADGACNPVPESNPVKSSFATLVYEPYVSEGNAAVQPGIWQSWDVSAGKFWSTRSVGSLQKSQGAYTYTLEQIKEEFPDAVVLGYGLNVGSGNPSYDIEADGFIFNETTYNFEQALSPTTKDSCRRDGWKTFNTPSFHNQWQCLEYVQRHAHEIEGEVRYTAFGLKRKAVFSINTANTQGKFRYSDDNHDWYTVNVTSVKVSGKTGYFAGQVNTASNPGWVGQWLFAKVQDGTPDQIWGDFTDMASAQNDVATMATPPSGPFAVTKGNLKVN